MPDKGVVQLTTAFQQDIRWWQAFAPLYNGVSLVPMSDWSNPDAIVSCDACLKGCGGWFEGEFFHSPFPCFVVVQLHINALELLTLVVALKLWGMAWKGYRIKLFCDNEASVTVLNTGRTRDPFLQACLREICFFAARFECELKAVHLPGTDNRIPDLLSRWELGTKAREEFRSRTCHLSTVECCVPDSLFRFSHNW